MSLILEGVSLAIEGAALVIDCACCFKEGCEALACRFDEDCADAGLNQNSVCFCRAKRCTSNPSCGIDEDCPEGYECVNGLCVPICLGQPCTADGDCHPLCKCIDGGCFLERQLYYCHGDPNDDTAPGECKKGKPEKDLGGPYLSYGLCAASGCEAKFSCNPVAGDCYPDPNGQYEELTECQKACGDVDNDLGRCCESTVCYDADGEVISVTAKCAQQGLGGQPCCGGQMEPIDPNNPAFGEKCENTVPCRKGVCISDEPQPFPSCRTFRQFNSLFDNCDDCPSLGLGPCCYEVDGVATCDMHDKGTCEDVLNGEWKGNNWFTCEDARDPQVDLLLDFACPNCNGKGDCACTGDQYCYGQKCRDCNAPLAVNDQGFVILDQMPIIGDKWEFRSRDCNDGVSTQDQAINIYGQRADGTNDLLVSIDNSDVNSTGLTQWTYDSTECFVALTARMAVGESPAVLCRQKTEGGNREPPVNCNPIPVGEEGECECPGGPDCSEDDESLAQASYSWSPFTDRLPDGLILKVCARQYRTQWWVETSSQTLMIDSGQTNIDGDTCYIGKTSSFQYIRLLAYLSTTGWTDVTDDWVDSTTNADEVFTDLLRAEYYSEDLGPLDPDWCEPSGIDVKEGSFNVYQELYDVGCEKPDPLADCGGANFRFGNPLP